MLIKNSTESVDSDKKHCTFKYLVAPTVLIDSGYTRVPRVRTFRSAGEQMGLRLAHQAVAMIWAEPIWEVGALLSEIEEG